MNDNPQRPEGKTRATRYGLFSSIRGRLFLLLLCVLVPVMLVQGVYAYVRFRELMESASFENTEMSRAAAEAFNGFIVGLVHEEAAIGVNLTMPAHVPADEMERVLELNEAEFPSVRNFSWLDPHGRVIMSSQRSDVGLDLSGREYVRKLVSGRKWVVSDLVRSRLTGRPGFSVSLAVRGKKGNLLGIVTAAIDPEKLKKVIPIHLSGDEAVAIIDSRGAAVYELPEGKWSWGRRNIFKNLPAVRKALKGLQVAGVIPAEDSLAAFAPIRSFDWAACASRSRNGIMAPIESQMFRDVLVFFLVAAAAFLGAFMLSEGIAGSIRRLLEHASALGGGDVESAIEARGPAELKAWQRP